VLFLLGAIAAAALVGGALGAAGHALGSDIVARPIRVLAAAVALAYATAELTGRWLPVPSSPWRVPQRWGLLGQPVFGAAFGVALGTGFVTAVTYAGYYFLLATTFVVSDPLVGATIMAMFGATRGLTTVLVPLVAVARRRQLLSGAIETNAWWTRSISPRLAPVRAGILLLTAAAFGLAGSP